MKYIINSLFFIILLVCFSGIIYLVKFSEEAQQKSFSESILEKDNKELISAFYNYKLISIEVNDIFHKNLKFNKMFKLTFKSESGIKQFYLHERNIDSLSKNIFYKNKNSNTNYTIFQNYFSNLFSHYSYNKEKEIINFMLLFVNQGLVKRNP
tara:strand:- start:6375 stop:6833 length:459 start_codon:yes stop_codon:yes gene_type:complete